MAGSSPARSCGCSNNVDRAEVNVMHLVLDFAFTFLGKLIRPTIVHALVFGRYDYPVEKFRWKTYFAQSKPFNDFGKRKYQKIFTSERNEHHRESRRFGL